MDLSWVVVDGSAVCSTNPEEKAVSAVDGPRAQPEDCRMVRLGK